MAQIMTLPALPALPALPVTFPADPVRRRNSTYLALACANAVSQGSNTRKMRHMFENPPVKETLPPLSRQEIQQSIIANRIRRNSIQQQQQQQQQQQEMPEVKTQAKAEFASAPLLFRSLTSSASLPAQLPVQLPVQRPVSPPPVPAKPANRIQRCHNCSSILPARPEPEPEVKQQPVEAPAVDNTDASGNASGDASGDAEVSNVPTNREVLPEELPKRDTVKNARHLFEKSGSAAGIPTLMTASTGSMLHPPRSGSSAGGVVKRCESTQSLNSIRNFRWPVATSPTPSTPYFRSTAASWRHSTDVDSVVSELSCDWSSDVESDDWLSTSAPGGSWSDAGDATTRGRHGRYIPPQVLQKIRSYGMTLTYVNGRMVDADDADDADDVSDAGDAYVNNNNNPTTANNLRNYLPCAPRSAGQSRAEVIKTSNRNNTELKKKLPVQKQPQQQQQHQQQQQQQPKEHQKPPRIISCLPKSGSERRRHSSGDSSASSGVSSAGSAGSDHSAHTSPFSSLRRHAGSNRKQLEAPEDLLRCVSPPPGNNSGIRKSLGSSPFGLYSVVYDFHRLPTGASTCL